MTNSDELEWWRTVALLALEELARDYGIATIEPTQAEIASSYRLFDTTEVRRDGYGNCSITMFDNC